MALFLYNYSTNPTIWVAFAYYDPGCGAANQNFRKQGWWQLDSGEVFNAWNADLRSVNRFAYIYAETANNSRNWSGKGNAWLTVDPTASFNQCAFQNTPHDQWVDFFEIDFTWAPPGWDLEVGFREDGILTFAASLGRPH
jgi:hypothetical protein